MFSGVIPAKSVVFAGIHVALWRIEQAFDEECFNVNIL